MIVCHAEGRTVAAVIGIAQLYDRAVHIAHVSTKEEVHVQHITTTTTTATMLNVLCWFR